MVPAVLFGYAELPARLQLVPPWATIFTSMFLHGGWLHLIGNMIYLWIFGKGLEFALGPASPRPVLSDLRRRCGDDASAHRSRVRRCR